MKYNPTGNEKGLALVVGTLLLLVATAVGVIALSTSTTNVMISGNQRLSETNFAAADSGVSVSIPIIETAASERGILQSDYPNITLDLDDTSPANSIPDLVDDLIGTQDNQAALDNVAENPDLTFVLDSTPISVDVDYLYSAYAPGSAIEFASGYEGIGKGAGAGGGVVFYGINSLAEGSVGSQTQVCAIYRDRDN